MKFVPEELVEIEKKTADRRKFLPYSGAAMAAIGIGTATRGMALSSPLAFLDTPMESDTGVEHLGRRAAGILNDALALEHS